MEYDALDEESVPAYLAESPDFSNLIDPSTLTASEVGDGNLNLVFICIDAAGRSVVLKQSLPYVRVAPSWSLTAERAAREARGLSVAASLSPDTSPAFHGYDSERHVLAMEDLSHLEVLRGALDRGDKAKGVEGASGKHIARIAFGTSVFAVDPQDFRSSVAEATNPELCEITEDLVFAEPLIDHEHNVVHAALLPVVLDVRSDPELVGEVSRLRTEFMTRTESLIHGDLHTGSIMVGIDGDECVDARMIDAEFCCYGPVAFDLGMLAANAAMAQARAIALDRSEQADWLSGFGSVLWDGFEAEIRRLWPERRDRFANDAALSQWLERVERDAIGFAGCEMIRRIVGFAKVSDIESLEADAHVRAAEMVLRTAHRLLVDPPRRLSECGVSR